MRCVGGAGGVVNQRFKTVGRVVPSVVGIERIKTHRRIAAAAGVDLISDVLPFGRLWYEPNAIGYAKTAGGPDRVVDEVKLVYAKNTKWLLSGPHQLQKFAQ
jgi:hypothetical protein